METIDPSGLRASQSSFAAWIAKGKERREGELAMNAFATWSLSHKHIRRRKANPRVSFLRMNILESLFLSFILKRHLGRTPKD